MTGLRHLDLFSGIGGFAYGLEKTGHYKTVAFCEQESFCQRVLKKHWPGTPVYNDVREVTKSRLVSDGIGDIDIITAGWPCQDMSIAGNKAGLHADRSGLWFEIPRILGELRPKYALMENVSALLSGDRGGWFGRVLGDLAEIGYDTEWHCIPASELGAYHHRDRVWLICYTEYPRQHGSQNHEGHHKGDDRYQEGQDAPVQSQRSNPVRKCPRCHKELTGVRCWCNKLLSDTESQRVQGQRTCREQVSQTHAGQIISLRHRERCRPAYWGAQSKLDRVVNGLPDRVDRVKALGNAIVPQVAECLAYDIWDYECQITR